MHSPESTKYFAKNLQFSTILRIFAARMDKSVLRDEWEANHITPFYHNVEQEAIAL